MTVDVITVGSYGGRHFYWVVVDNKQYDEFDSSVPLTFSQIIDVQNYYREALDPAQDL